MVEWFYAKTITPKQEKERKKNKNKKENKNRRTEAEEGLSFFFCRSLHAKIPGSGD